MNKKRFPYTQNREISWLKFNQRVLEEAADPTVPLLERLKFLAIFTSNLDEFFMVRAGSLQDVSLISPDKVDEKSGWTPGEQLNAIFEEAKRLYAMRDNVAKNLLKTLREVHIEFLTYKNLTKEQQKNMRKLFDTQLKPLLAPQIINLHHPFPFLMNKELYIFFQIQDGTKIRNGIVPVPNYIDRLIPVNAEHTHFILAENLILTFLDRLFDKGKIIFKTVIRVTRNADINLNTKDIEEDEDYRQFMKKILKRRSRLNPVRLEIDQKAPDDVINYLCKHLGITRKQVFISRNAPLETSHFFAMIDQLPSAIRQVLTYKPLVARSNERLDPNQSIISQVLDHDILLSYPYEDIDYFIDLLREASRDPDVKSIKITIYRLAKHSRIVHYLIAAAENGIDVTVLMELRARFDEQHNIVNAERLETAGCNVIYGFDDYKVHSKILSITLERNGKLQTITQIGTGNYNERTSRQYTDFSLITSNPVIGEDGIEFFKNMNLSNLSGSYKKLLVSPRQLKMKVMDMIEEEMEKARDGKAALICLKMNSITDIDLMGKLSEASCAGVPIKMIVRGICCLLPGVAGYTENIEIHQIVGRFLEHARIYSFGAGDNPTVYISSADFMTRNTERRVEVAVPVEDSGLKKELLEYFDIQFSDNLKGRVLLDTGYYAKMAEQQTFENPVNAQEAFIERAAAHEFKPVVQSVLEKEVPSFFKALGRLFGKKK